MDDSEGGHVEAVREACDAVLVAVGATRVSLWGYDERAHTVSPFVSVGAQVPTRRVARRWSRLPVEEVAVFAERLRTGQPVPVADASAVALPAGLVDDFAVSSLWVAPLHSRDGVVGILTVEPVACGEHPALGSLVPVVARVMGEAQAWRLAHQYRAEAELLLELTASSFADSSTTDAAGHLCQVLARRLGIRRACLFLLEAGVLVPTAAHNADGSIDKEGFQAFRAAPTPLPIAVAALSGWKTMIATDPSSDLIAGWWGERFGIVSGLAVPLGTRAEPLGVLTLDDATPRRFTDPVVRLAEAAGAQFSLLYERAREVEDHSRRLRIASAVRSLLQEGALAATVSDAADVVARIGHTTLEVDNTCAYLLDADGVITEVVTVGVEEHWQHQIRAWTTGVRAADAALGQALLATREPILIHDAAASALLPDELISALRVRSFAAIPLWTTSRFYGCVTYSMTRSPRLWSRDDRDLVEQLALECALIMENAQLRAAERARAEELAHLALHDPLTGLPNRVLLADRLDAALRQTTRSQLQVAVLFVDLTSFKQINDHFGHDAGDRVLIETAARLVGVVRPGDTVARLAGDEFIIVLADITADEATDVAARVCETIKQPVNASTGIVTVEASVGIALGAAPASTGPSLLAQADTAMYRAKRNGPGYATYHGTTDRDPRRTNP